MPCISICVTMAITSLYTSTKPKFPEAFSLLFSSGWYSSSFGTLGSMRGRLNLLRSRCFTENSSQLNPLVGTWLGRSIFSCFCIFLSSHLFGPTNNACLHILFKYCPLEEASHLCFIRKKGKIDKFINFWRKNVKSS